MREVDLMRLSGGIGGVISLIEAILGFNERRFDYSYVILLIVTIVLSVIIILSVIKPGDPVPLNWLLFVGIGILMLIFSSLAGGILTLIAGFIGYTEK